jgi:thiamine biosynthesis protein ThiS
MVTINNRDRVDWRQGMTVRELLDELGYTYALITVTINGVLVAEEDYATYLVPDQAEVTVFHLAHGG